jgi:hypothetical protein
MAVRDEPAIDWRRQCVFYKLVNSKGGIGVEMRNFAVAFMFGLLAFSSPVLADPPKPPANDPCAVPGDNPPISPICVVRGASSKLFGQAVADNAKDGINPPVSP